MYKRGNGKDRLLVGIYVDDLLITGPYEEEILEFNLQMKELFQMSDLRLLNYYLGIKVQQKLEGTTLWLEVHGKKILESYSMGDCNPTYVTMEPLFKLSKRVKDP